MILVLKTSPEQEAEINGLLAAQQDSSSPQFHSWLTPAEFGEEFGLANEDIEKIVAWLQSRGLRVDKVAQGRRTLEFSGETRQVEAAFRCELHRYEVNGEIHLANANAEISIPAGLAPAIEGVLSLHDFHSQPQHRVSTATPKFNTDPAGMRFRLTISRTSTMSRRFGRLSQMAPDRASQLSGARMSI